MTPSKTPELTDVLIERMLGERAGRSAPVDLLPEVVATIRVERQVHRGWLILLWPPRRAHVVLVLAALMIAALLAVAVIGGPPPRPEPLGEQGQVLAYQEGSSIYAARPDGSNRQHLSAAEPFARLPVFSPDGQRLAFVAPPSAEALSGRLMVVPVDGSGPVIDVSHGIEVVASDVPQISWSPDGTQIAFSGAADGVATIFVATGDGSAAPRAISDATAQRDLPTWSPDGEWIGFREKDPDGIRTRLARARPDGTDVQDVVMVIAEDAFLSKLRWFTGTAPTLYWFSPGFGSDASAYIDLGFGHKNEPWTGEPGGFADFGLPWSPDGEQLVFLTESEGVIVADYDRNEPYEGQVRSLGPVAGCWVDWAPDGTSLYGGAPDGCDGVVTIPLASPSAATRLPGSTAGFASWQPMAAEGQSR